MRVVVVVLMIVRRIGGISGPGEFVSWLAARVHSCAPVSAACWVSSPVCGVVVDSVGLKGCMPSRKRACRLPIQRKSSHGR